MAHNKLEQMIGLPFAEVDNFIREKEEYAYYMTRISTTSEDYYYFYSIDDISPEASFNHEGENRCIEVYFNKDGIVTDIIDIFPDEEYFL